MNEADVRIIDAIQRLLEDPEAIEEIARVQETLLSFDDVAGRVPWCKSTIREMVKRRQIPMVKVQGRWIITREEFRKAARRDFDAPPGTRTVDISR